MSDTNLSDVQTRFKEFILLLKTDPVDNVEFKAQVDGLLRSKVFFHPRREGTEGVSEFEYADQSYAISDPYKLGAAQEQASADRYIKTALQLCSNPEAPILQLITYQSFIRLVRSWGRYQGNDLRDTRQIPDYKAPPITQPTTSPEDTPAEGRLQQLLSELANLIHRFEKL